MEFDEAFYGRAGALAVKGFFFSPLHISQNLINYK